MRQIPDGTFDLLIIGGGINGAGIARDAATRGLTVLLAEAEDLASATSSASSKLIHGGLRYLEQYAFRLVREALAERETLLRMAPHIIWPLRFVLPHVPDLRPAWTIRAGLWLYDHLGERSLLPGSRGLDLRTSPYGAALKPDLRRAFVYSDCWVDDARLVVLNARAAADRGASINVRTRVTRARRDNGAWRATLIDQTTGAEREVAARGVVNAAGPWAREVLGGVLGVNATSTLRLVKGSHIVVPRRYEGEHAYILQNDDRRVVFVIPYEERYTLIGTTDIPYTGDARSVSISSDEIAYLCRAASRYLTKPLAPQDVTWSYAGVRPLYDDGKTSVSEVTRDYVLDLDAPADGAPLLSVFGGKITTYRRLAEQALKRLAPFFPQMLQGPSSSEPLPGGALPEADFGAYLADLRRRFAFVPADHLRRLARRHGSRCEQLLRGVRQIDDLGAHFGTGLYEREVNWMLSEEWAGSASDILFRRSKLGLHLTPAEQATLVQYLERKHGS